MDIEQRVSTLEIIVNGLINKINIDKYYADSNVTGVRKNVGDITPYTDTKKAYIGDTEITFYGTPATGNLTVYCPGNYHVDRLVDRIFITFDELEEVTEITISIL